MGTLYSVDGVTGNIITEGSITAGGGITSTSTTAGFQLPSMTTTQRNAIPSPTTGLEIFNTTTNQSEFWNGSIWIAVGGSGSPGGSNTDIQFNNSGAFGGSSYLTWDGTSLVFGPGTAAINSAYGSVSFDSGQITSDGSGNFTANSSVTTGFINSDVGLFYSDGSGNLMARSLAVTYTVELLDQSTVTFIDTVGNGISISAPTTTANYNLYLPSAQGVGALQNDGSGNLSFGLANTSAIAQTASITTTTLFTPTVTGTYRVSIYVVDTGSDATYVLQGTVGWTDDAQAQTATTSALTNAVNGYTQSTFFIEATTGNPITYAVALTGTATFNVYVVAERLS